METYAFESHIRLTGVFNFRDLGGHGTQHGGALKWRTVFRNGELQNATVDDVRHLTHEIGLSTVLDLRNAEELELRGVGPQLIADSQSHPMVFHCTAGKDRAGVLAALLLGILGVSDREIIENYAMSDAAMKTLIARGAAGPEWTQPTDGHPDYVYRAVPESMAFFLSFLQREYGSARGYVERRAATRGSSSA